MLRKQITVDDLPENEIQEAQVEIFLSDAAQDLEDYALGRVSLEQLGDRLRYHKAVAEVEASTLAVDRAEQDAEGRASDNCGMDGVA